MRIIRGILKGKQFSIPKSFPSRPTTDFAKEGLFNILEHKYTLNNLNILDLCAGTGNISFEFCSREAGFVTAVDQNNSCLFFINKNIVQFELKDVMKTYKSDAISYLKRCKNTFDLIFFDPPFESKIYDECINLIFSKKLLNKNGILIVEHNNKKNFSEFPSLLECRSFGNVYFSFFNEG